MNLDELKLDDFFETLRKNRDPQVVTLMKAFAANNPEAVRAVLEILSDQYPEEVEEILAEYSDEDEFEGNYRHEDHDHFEDEDLYENEIMFGDYEMAHEADLDAKMDILLQNPEAINALLILMAQNTDLDSDFLELLKDPDFELDLEDNNTPSPRKKK